jgi:hypothetical protein
LGLAKRDGDLPRLPSSWFTSPIAHRTTISARRPMTMPASMTVPS